jgi:phosphotransferase system  glucose/maltose/N-acetylglucosamine-specific IIC component
MLNSPWYYGYEAKHAGYVGVPFLLYYIIYYLILLQTHNYILFYFITNTSLKYFILFYFIIAQTSLNCPWATNLNCRGKKQKE